MDIRDKIDKLDQELSEATSIMFSKKSAVDVKKCQEYVAEIRRSLPESIQQASFIISQKETIINQAEAEANAILSDAKEQFQKLLDENTIIIEAQAVAEKNLKKAESQCNQMLENTKQKIDIMLKNIEDYLMDSLRIIRNNREELAGSLLRRKD